VCQGRQEASRTKLTAGASLARLARHAEVCVFVILKRRGGISHAARPRAGLAHLARFAGAGGLCQAAANHAVEPLGGALEGRGDAVRQPKMGIRAVLCGLALAGLCAKGGESTAPDYWVKLVCESSDRIATVHFGPNGLKVGDCRRLSRRELPVRREFQSAWRYGAEQRIGGGYERDA
jgi:hypothetical protein